MDKQKIRSTLELIRRSPDRGEGWRSVSEVCWPLLDGMPDELIEIDEPNRRVRITQSGDAVLMFG